MSASATESGRGPTRAVAFTVWILGVAGLGHAGLWAWLSPTDILEVRADGVFLLDPQGEGRIGSQLVFAGIGAAIGVVAAVRCWRRARFPIRMTAALAVGGLLSAVIAWQVGVLLGPADVDTGDVGALVEAPLAIDAYGVLLATAIAAVGTWAFLLLVTEDQGQPADVGRRANEATDAPVSSSSTDGDTPMSSPRLPPET